MSPETNEPEAVPAEQRQLNLLHALRHSLAGLTAVQLLESVAGYDGTGPSQRRKFERDKDTLRELGIQIRTEGEGAAVEGVETRYRIADSDYALPTIHLNSQQADALLLAARSWQQGALPAAARRAVTKLLAVADTPTGAGSEINLKVDAGVPAELLTAVDQCCLICFDYASPSSGQVSCRTVEPHFLELREGAWYLQAVEPNSGRELTFRLQRIIGKVAPIGEPGAFQRRLETTAQQQTAILALSPGKGLALRAAAVTPPPKVGELTVPAGRDLVCVPYDDALGFAGLLAAMGPDVVVLAPQDLQEAVRAHLAAVAALEAADEESED
ncbi:Proteasome accessory factor B [Actinomyces bovis]|uniref:Proteasome accessory factor B n=1 Tax=Actinomyces bovis TaxID=1658 RepID=A0ABY1VPF8_9ACTO|nr:WYL domain-containing protein [Actinomyces bovis]SPT54019.1 Proteasome accessory factor B [Actinomyces bovis]VEG53844.1 Proteasome accessory factor B [Actinomyces israelii]